MARNENNLLSVPYNNEEEVEHDYLSTLPLGYRFCPTASEIIVYYLMPKIETGTNHPKWRLYEVNFYDYHPDQLAERYWPFEKKWYFFTPRTRMTPNGDRPNRRTGDFGYWKTTQKDTTVYMYDDVNGLEVGKKRCLVYYDASNKKSQWLMHEYTTIDPNIPVGSREDKMKLTDWVLCEIYKKETDGSKQQVLSARNQHLDELSRRKRILMHHQGSSYQTSASTQVFQQQIQSTYQDKQFVESNEDNFSYNYEEVLELDYADSLNPGYRFCPTDSEIIVYYLQPKIETGEQHPKCRYYIADFYGDTPDNLAANHRHCEYKWYFLTSRDRKYPNGNRPNRRIKNFGFWKATTKDKVICDDVTGEIVGRRKSLAYYDKYSRKTPWLMHEHINNNPNIPTGSRSDDMMKLSDWVLAKIYKKDENQNDNNNAAYQVENMMNPEDLMEDQNQLQDEPSPRRRRLSVNQESNQTNGAQYIQIQDGNHYSGVDLPMVAPAQFMCDSDKQLAIQPMDTLSGSSLIHPTFQDPPQGIVTKQVQTSDGSSTWEYHHDQTISTSTNDFRFSSDASCSYSTDLNSMASTNAFQQAYNSYQDSEHPQATLQSFPDEPMEWTEDDLCKEIVDNLDEENMSPRSSIDVLQEANNYYQATEEPEVMLQSFHAQPTEWTQEDLDKELMENLDEDNLSPRSSTNVIQQAYNLWQDTEVTLESFLNQPEEWTQDDLIKEIVEKVEEDNLSPWSLSKDHHQEFEDYFQDTKQPQVALEDFSHQLVEWSEDDFEREIMESLQSL
ncbi:NAC domain-containing protein [Tanacetum coccineum]